MQCKVERKQLERLHWTMTDQIKSGARTLTHTHTHSLSHTHTHTHTEREREREKNKEEGVDSSHQVAVDKEARLRCQELNAYNVA